MEPNQTDHRICAIATFVLRPTRGGTLGLFEEGQVLDPPPIEYVTACEETDRFEEQAVEPPSQSLVRSILLQSLEIEDAQSGESEGEVAASRVPFEPRELGYQRSLFERNQLLESQLSELESSNQKLSHAVSLLKEMLASTLAEKALLRHETRAVETPDGEKGVTEVDEGLGNDFENWHRKKITTIVRFRLTSGELSTERLFVGRERFLTPEFYPVFPDSNHVYIVSCWLRSLNSAVLSDAWVGFACYDAHRNLLIKRAVRDEQLPFMVFKSYEPENRVVVLQDPADHGRSWDHSEKELRGFGFYLSSSHLDDVPQSTFAYERIVREEDGQWKLFLTEPLPARYSNEGPGKILFPGQTVAVPHSQRFVYTYCSRVGGRYSNTTAPPVSASNYVYCSSGLIRKSGTRNYSGFLRGTKFIRLLVLANWEFAQDGGQLLVKDLKLKEIIEEKLL